MSIRHVWECVEHFNEGFPVFTLLFVDLDAVQSVTVIGVVFTFLYGQFLTRAGPNKIDYIHVLSIIYPLLGKGDLWVDDGA